jgi:L-methionine (R)-S-oxide reductase
MSESWVTYLQKRLHETGGPLGLTQIKVQLTKPDPIYVEWSSTTDPIAGPHFKQSISLGGCEVGTLVAYSDQPGNFETSTVREGLESLALQFAAIVLNPSPENGVEIDRRMGQLKSRSEAFDWCGVYRVEGERLFLAAFRGAATPHAVIHKDHGICGAAVRENRSLNIEDVTTDPRYLSCDTRTKSEAVIPIRNAKGEAIGEVDVDSHRLNAFGVSEMAMLEKLAGELSALLA